MMKHSIPAAVVILVAGLFAETLEAAPFIVKDGKPNAEIVIGDSPTRMQKFAAGELRDVLRKISGAELPIVSGPSGNQTVEIYVGETAFTRKMGIGTDDLKDGAYRIKSGDDYLVLIGNDADYVPKKPYARTRSDMKRALKVWDDITGGQWGFPGAGGFKRRNRELGVESGDGKGSFNAVNDFLRSLGARWYFPGEFGECLPEMTSIPLPEVDKTVRPDFALRTFGGAGYTFSKTTGDMARWVLRLGLHRKGGLPGGHGINYAIHRDKIRDSHPEWFWLRNGVRDIVSRGGKPCLSSPELLRSNVLFARTYFDVYDADVVSVMPTDGYVQLCQCRSCENRGTRDRGYNGFLSDYVWSYVNGVARELFKTHPDKKVICGAYTAYQLPPEKIDVLCPNVMVQLAQARRKFTIPEVRERWLKLRKQWKEKLSGEKPFKTHDNYSSSGQSPFPMVYPRLIVEDLRSLKEICVGDYIEENSVKPNEMRGGKVPVKLALNHLNIYVTSRFWWDADQDLDALLDEYYQKYYGPAAAEMKAFIEFSEANWPKMQRDADLVAKTLALIAAAREAAGEDSIYARRVALIDKYLDRLEQLRDKIAIGRKDNPRARAYDRRGNRKITIDGKLDDEFWEGMATYRLKEIQTGRKPDHSTWFRVGWRNGNLYFAVHCDEPRPEAMTIGATRNEDASIWSGDTVEFLLETQNHAYYQIAVNPAGAVMDMDWKTGKNSQWDSDAEVATFTGDDFWNVEIKIPVADEAQEENLPNQLVSGRKPSVVEPWYFNVGRSRKAEGGSEASMFSPTGKKRFHVPEKFGILYIE